MRVQAADYAIVGEEPTDDQPKKCWKVLIDEYKGVNPRDFFITTGEAIVKLDHTIKCTRNLLESLKKLRAKMIKSKSTSKYLETSWDDGILVVKRKDVRSKEKEEEKE